MTENKKYLLGSIVRHKSFGRGQVVDLDAPFVAVRFPEELKRIPQEYMDMDLAADADQDLERMKFAMRSVFEDLGVIELNQSLGKRWQGGEVVLVPGKKDTQEKRIPLDQFFKKIISIREKLRVLEQKINNNPKLDQEEKIEYQGYITRSYGTLTTFNVLFADQGEGFKGSGE